jgi:CheY-like chemotaxis protein
MSKNIIIVEDDPFSQNFYEYVFRKAGFTSTIIEDGDLLIEKLKTIEASLIIMDINLQNTYLNGEKADGIMISRYLKQSENFSKIPIILVSAYPVSQNGKNYFEESLADDYITKPITDFNFLIGKVNKLIAE